MESVAGEKVHTLRHLGTGLELAFNHAGDVLATISWDVSQGIKFWNPYHGTKIFEVPHDGRLSRPLYSPSDELVCRWSQNWSILQSPLTQLNAGREYKTLELFNDQYPSSQVEDISLHPQGRLVAVGVYSGPRLVDLKSGQLRAIYPIQGKRHILFQKENLYVSSGDGLVCSPILRSKNKPRRWIIKPAQRPFPFGNMFDLAQSAQADNSMMAAAYLDGALVWPEKQPYHSTDIELTDCRSVAVSPDGMLLATGSHNGTGLKVWNTQTGKLVKSFLPNTKHTAPQFSPDGRWLHDRNGVRWDVKTWTEELVSVGDSQKGNRHAVAYSPDSRIIALCIYGRDTIRLLDAETLKELAQLQDPLHHSADFLTFSDDGTQLFSTSNSGRAAHVWDLRKIREGLKQLDLDWKAAPFPPEKQTQIAEPEMFPLEIEIQDPDRLNDRKLFNKIELAALEEKLKDDPNDAITRFQLGYVLLALNRDGEALEQFKLTIKLRPEFSMAYLAAIDMARTQPDYSAVVKYVTLAQRFPKFQNDVILTHRARAYQWMEHYSEAIADWTTLLKTTKDRRLVLGFRGYAYGLLGQTEKALTDYMEYVQLGKDAQNPEHLHQMARGTAVKDWNPDATESPDQLYALAMIKTALQFDPHHAGRLSTLALIQCRLGRIPEAWESIQLRIKKSPTDENEFQTFCRCLVMLEQGKRDEAKKLFEQTQKQLQTQASVHRYSQWFTAELQQRFNNPEDYATPLTILSQTKQINCAAFQPDGETIVGGSQSGLIKFWNAKSGELLQVCINHEEQSAVKSLAYSPKGDALLSAHWNRKAHLRDPKTGRIQLTFEGHTGPVWQAVFSPDGQQVATASQDQTVRIWDAKTGQSLHILNGHKGQTSSLAFSPDGDRLITASKDKTLKLWDAKHGQFLRTFSGHAADVRCVAFHPDGKQIASASASDDGTVKIWDVKTAKEIHTLKSHRKTVHCVTYSPDGRWLLSGGQDKTLRLWNADTGQLLRTFRGHESLIRWVDFNPNGKRFVSASFDGMLKVWDLSEIPAE